MIVGDEEVYTLDQPTPDVDDDYETWEATLWGEVYDLPGADRDHAHIGIAA